MKIDGGCHCGHIKFRAEVDTDKVLICHCTDCQTLSGSAYRTVVLAIDNTFEMVSGKLKLYEKTADDGSIRIQSFCPDCGTPIYSSPPPGKTGFVGIRVGSIKQRDQLVPKNQIWTRSAQPWTQDLSQMSKTETCNKDELNALSCFQSENLMSNEQIQYPDEFINRLEILWGEGFLSPGGADEVKLIFDGIDLNNKSVLDIGCGTGGAEVVLAGELNIDRVVGIDVEPQLIERTKKTGQKKGYFFKSRSSSGGSRAFEVCRRRIRYRFQQGFTDSYP